MTRRVINNPAQRAGTAPQDGSIIGTREGWILYHRFDKQGGKKRTWANVKLISQFKIKGKANYWLAYCLEAGDFHLNRDMRALDISYPDLLPWVAEKVVEHAQAMKNHALRELLM